MHLKSEDINVYNTLTILGLRFVVYDQENYVTFGALHVVLGSVAAVILCTTVDGCLVTLIKSSFSSATGHKPIIKFKWGVNCVRMHV